MDHDIVATCPDALQSHTVANRTHRERSDCRTTNTVMDERFEKMLRVNVSSLVEYMGHTV